MCGHVVTTNGEEPKPRHWDDGHICGPYVKWTGERPRRPRPKIDLMVNDGVLMLEEDFDED
jgi:hypothetical protein